MKGLFRFIQRFNFVILFLLIEGFAASIIFSNDNRKNATFLSSANAVSGFVYENFNFIKKYFSLKEENENLARENTKFRNSFDKAFRSNVPAKEQISNKNYLQHYFFVPASVINVSINRKQNYLTLNKGKSHGIKSDMAVVSPLGVVGLVKNVSENFCTVISILNTKIGISAKIKKSNFYGSVMWNGGDYQTVQLEGIPNHAEVSAGDTIVTSGYSLVFPEGEPIGIVANVQQEDGDNFYNIDVKLNVDYKSLLNVYVIQNLLKDEQFVLEKNSEND